LAVLTAGIGGGGCKKHVSAFDEAASAVGAPEFFAREQVARWLLAYDTVALLARAGGEADPLCWQENGVWYTRSEDRISRLQGGELVPVEDADAAPSDALLRALARARNRDREGDEVGLAAYARELDTGIEVWLLPVGVEQVRIGNSWRYVYSESGRELREEQSWSRGSQVLGADAELDLTLQSMEEEHPTVAELFFALYHRDAFKSVTIETARYRVTPMELDGALGWGRSAR